MNLDQTISLAHIIRENPVISECYDIRKNYYSLIVRYLKSANMINKKVVKSQLQIYKKALLGNKEESECSNQVNNVNQLVLFDFIFLIGFNINEKKANNAVRQLVSDLGIEDWMSPCVISYCSGNIEVWDKIKQSKVYNDFSYYLDKVHCDMTFMQKKATNILITATMSAGKSTFINAVCGKNVTLSQNMACTSKIHSIIGKPFEDGLTCESDHTLIMDATSKELLNDNEKNHTGRIKVSTFLRGPLGGQRIVLNDTPGVNSSENLDHKTITERMVKRRNYKLLIYVLNATQLGTNDDEEHLKYVRSIIGKKPIMFLLNKVDELDYEVENPFDIIERRCQYLKQIGFVNPMICPVSSKVGLLAKRSKYETLSRFEKKELDRAIMKFEEESYDKYYRENFGFEDVSFENQDEVDKLLRDCGLTYIELLVSKIFK